MNHNNNISEVELAEAEPDEQENEENKWDFSIKPELTDERRSEFCLDNENEMSVRINPFAVLKELQKIFMHNFPTFAEVESSTDNTREIVLANRLFEAYSDLIAEIEDIPDGLMNPDDFEPIETVDVKVEPFECDDEMTTYPPSQCSDVEEEADDSDSTNSEMEYWIKEAEDLDSNQDNIQNLRKGATVSIERKKEIIDMWKRHPKWKLNTLIKKGAKELRSYSTLYKWKKQIERGPDSLIVFRGVDSHTFQQFVEALNAGQVIQYEHIKGWALSKFAEFKRSDLKFTAGQSWFHFFKNRHKIKFRGHKLGYALSDDATVV